MKYFTFCFTILLIIAGCGSGDTVTYNCNLFDNKGNLAASGKLDLPDQLNGNKEFSGSWDIDLAAGSSISGGSYRRSALKFGSGKLNGSIKKGTIHVNLNPGWADNNVWLSAKYAKAGFKGKWSYATDAGDQVMGTFSASKQ